jgi:hypothetical protein
LRRRSIVIEQASNLRRLKEEGVYTADEITPEERQLVQSMTDEEVDMLIHLYKKLGGTAEGREEIRPNFPL